MNWFRTALLVLAGIGIAYGDPLWSKPGLLEEFRSKKFLSSSRWLWCKNAITSGDLVIPGDSSLFRFSFDADSRVKSGNFAFAADDRGDLYLNGKKIAPSSFAKAVRPGRNVVAISVKNIFGIGGMLYFADFTLESGRKISLRSTKAVRAADGHVPPEGWTAPDFDDSKWESAAELGDVTMYPFARSRNLLKSFVTDEERSAVVAACADNFTVPPELEKEPEPQARIVYKGNRPFIELNGECMEPDINLCGSSHQYALTSIAKTYELGFRIFRMEALPSRYEIAAGKYDFSDMDKQARSILKYAPGAKFMIRIMLGMPKWAKAHPDECIGYGNGPVLDAPGDERLHRVRMPSAASLEYRAEVSRFFTQFGEYIKGKPWGKRVIAVRPCWGVYTEWHCFGMYNSPDVGPAMTAAFRRFKGGLYANDNPPAPAERTEGAFFLDPVKKRKVLDFYECMAGEISDLLLLCAREVKRVLPGRLAGAYYGYIFSTHPPEGSNVMLEKVVSAPEIDFISNPAAYSPDVRRAGGSYCHRTVPATMHRYGKLPIIEDDMRFFHIAEACSSHKPITTTSARESRMTMRRNYLNKLFDGCGIQLCDPIAKLGVRPHSHDAPEVSLGMHEAMGAMRKAGILPVDSGNDTVVVVSPVERLRRDGAPKGNPRIRRLYTAQELLYRTGVTFDLCTLDDYLVSGKKWRNVVLLNIFSPSQREREALKAKLQLPGVSALWLIAPGSVTEKGFSDSAMVDLTGLPLAWSGACPHVDFSPRGTLPFPLHGVAKVLPTGARAAFIPEVPFTVGEWREVLEALGVKPVAPEGSYVRRHGNLLLFHVADAGRHELRLPGDLAGRKATELFSGKKIAPAAKLVVPTDGCDTLLYKFAE